MVGHNITLGIDPGTKTTGFALLSNSGNNFSLIKLGVINIPDTYSIDKMGIVYDEVSKLIIDNKPNILAIETQFLGKNVQSLLKLGRVQGVAILAALKHGVSVKEYPPRTVKKCVTGNGNATKQQVARVISALLNIDVFDYKYDATDALAIALCGTINEHV